MLVEIVMGGGDSGVNSNRTVVVHDEQCRLEITNVVVILRNGSTAGVEAATVDPAVVAVVCAAEPVELSKRPPAMFVVVVSPVS